MIQGTLYIVSAPSGAGKTTLIQELIQTHRHYATQVSISYTTRPMRSGEVDGKNYYFVPMEKFKHMIAENAFLEYAQVFDNYYGTSRNSIEQVLSTGVDVFVNIDWQGAQQIRSKIPDARGIFILPPSKEELDNRLRGRGQDNQEIIAKRMAQAITEMNHFSEFDYLIINDNFNTALSDLKAIIRTERLRLEHQKLRYDALISKLLAE